METNQSHRNMEELTVPEILQGFLRKEYLEHRAYLLQLLINQFANENESQCTDLVVTNNESQEGQGPSQSDEPVKSSSHESQPTNVDEDTFRQMTRILLDLVDNPKSSPEIINLSLAALTNATIKEQYLIRFMDLLETIDSPISTKFHKSIENFLSYNPQLESKEDIPELWENEDPLQHVGSILCNISQNERGRKILLHTKTNYMPKFPAQIRTQNPIRRRGVVGCIRSCLFDQDVHWWMLNEVKVLTPILIPLTVPTPFPEKDREGMDPTIWIQAENPEKKYENDFDIMKMLVECIILLCQRRGIREELRKKKVYPVLRNLDLKVEEEKVSAAIYEAVNFLIADEDPNTPIDTPADPPLAIENK